MVCHGHPGLDLVPGAGYTEAISSRISMPASGGSARKRIYCVAHERDWLELSLLESEVATE